MRMVGRLRWIKSKDCKGSAGHKEARTQRATLHLHAYTLPMAALADSSKSRWRGREAKV